MKKMKYIFIVIILFIASCNETSDGDFIPMVDDGFRCSGDSIEIYNQDYQEWQEWFNCQEYEVGHSGAVCPRQCCEFDNGVVSCCVK